MSSILDVDFILEKKKKVRLGYYYSTNGIKGHVFIIQSHLMYQMVLIF